MNSKKERFWVKFHLISKQGFLGLDRNQAKTLAGEDPDWLSRDLREAIQRKEYPEWKLCFQCMKEEDGYKDPTTFDCTKIWKLENYPLIEIGIIRLDNLPVDFHSEVEQVAFSPANIVPGIGFSPDKLLQGRLLIYDDTQTHRLGPNFKQIPVNRPQMVEPNTMYMGGHHQSEVQSKWPPYYPSNYSILKPDTNRPQDLPYRCDGPVDYYDYPYSNQDDDFYSQPREFLKSVISEKTDHLIDNIASNLSKIQDETLIKQVIVQLNKIDNQFGEKVDKARKDIENGTKEKSYGEKMYEKLHEQFVKINSPE
jgi:catalase